MSKKITITLNENQANIVTMTLSSHIMDMQEYDFDGNAAPLDPHSAGEARVITNVIKKIEEARK
jgi:hypothetical protein